MKGYGRNPLGRMQQRAIGTLLLLAMAPLLLLVAVQVVGIVAAMLWEMVGPVVPYLVVFFVLLGIYRLVVWRYRR